MDILRKVGAIVSIGIRLTFLVLMVFYPVATFLPSTSIAAEEVSGISFGKSPSRGMETERSISRLKGIVGTWLEDLGEIKIKVVFGEDGTFSRTMTEGSVTETVEGRYRLEEDTLVVEPEDFEPMRFKIIGRDGSRLIIQGDDGSRSQMTRMERGNGTPGETPTAEGMGHGAPAGGNLPQVGGSPDEGRAQQLRPEGEQEDRLARGGVKEAPDAPVPRDLPAEIKGKMVPEAVRPGLRLTFYMMTGSLPGSVNGWIPDEEGRWVDREGRRYGEERKGHSSHGLIQATVAGMDREIVALSQQFYLFNGEDTTPVFNKSLDSIVTPDTGGDYWMHPGRQAAILQSNPWNHVPQPGETVAKHVAWNGEDGTRNATAIAIIGEASRTTYIFDQESGFLLYLSRLTRQAPDIRDHSQTLPDSVSYATFLRFVSSRQLRLPWLDVPPPEIARRIRSVTYQGSTVLESPGSMPTPLRVIQELSVLRRGGDWIIFNGKGQSQGAVMPSEFKAVQGPGCTPPLIIPPSVLAKMRPGQQIDRDPKTGFEVSVSGNDGRYLTLQTKGPRQGFTYIYGMENGLMVRRISREITNPASPQMVTLRDISLAGVQ